MCNINKPLPEEVKEITGYKVVTKNHAGRYIGLYTHALVKVGKVADHSKNIFIKRMYNPAQIHLYNENMIGRISCFKDLEAATLLGSNARNYCVDKRVLKITLRDGLMEGDSSRMYGIEDSWVTYAGKEVVSFEEVKF